MGRGDPRRGAERGGSSPAWIPENCHLTFGLLSVSPAPVTSFPIKLMIRMSRESSARVVFRGWGWALPSGFPDLQKAKRGGGWGVGGGGGRRGHPLRQAGKVTVPMRARGPCKLSRVARRGNPRSPAGPVQGLKPPRGDPSLPP